MPRDVILTPEGLEELKAKIQHLSTERRREVAERIKEAREFGDISENSEYDDAKNEQAMLEKQIAELEEKLRSATVIDQKSVSTEAVSVGTTVHVKDQKTDPIGICHGAIIRGIAADRACGAHLFRRCAHL